MAIAGRGVDLENRSVVKAFACMHDDACIDTDNHFILKLKILHTTMYIRSTR